ncbi:uncharacterized protein LOC115332061 [Ixodes scapularis]|uniref:uncharacterized protein LOC115332061 n=1 Tax=Ixodes scapularis TaxID=6945 RepID=UPI001A9F803C|nr:uncharacterized protein LOC115332061 [Ixodes scapularis]
MVQVDTLVKEKRPLLFTSVIQSDEQVRILTGITSLQLIKNITAEFTDIREQVSPRGYSLDDADAVLMVMVKLYHNIYFSFLSVLFSIHRTTVSNLLKCCVCILSRVLGEAVFFPSKESVLGNLTVYFSPFKNTRVVLDCTEITLERPGDLASRISTYSHYKNYTAKVLVGMITFVGTAFGGRTSDSFLTKESAILDQCVPYVDHGMVDKGFLIESLCDDARVRMDRPPFLRKKRQMESSEALKNEKIARARVHVERAIQRLKAFKVLQQKFPTQLLPALDHTVKLLAGLTNLSKPILSSDKFL